MSDNQAIVDLVNDLDQRLDGETHCDIMVALGELCGNMIADVIVLYDEDADEQKEKFAECVASFVDYALSDKERLN